MYDFETKELEYLSAGIHKDVKILKISKEPSKKDGTGQTVLRITFCKTQNNNDYYYVFTAFPLDDDKIIERNQNKPNSKYSDSEAVANEYKWFSNKLKHIFGTFIPKEELIFKAKSWDELLDIIIEKAGTAYEGHSFEIKLVLDGNDRAGFPKYAFNPFIRNMTNTAVKIAIDPKYERIEPVIADASDSEEWGTQSPKDDKAPF